MPERLTESDIRDWVGDPSFGRGLAYYHARRVTDLRREGNTLKALCQGSAPEPYHVELTLAGDEIQSDLCTCPIGGGCKHVAALLLTWLHGQEMFREVEPLESTLERRSKPELTALIRQMLARHPDLETLIELETIKAGDVTAADPVSIRRLAERAFVDTRGDWRASYDVVSNLGRILALGPGYLDRSAWRDAWVIYDTVAQVLMENYQTVHDEEGELIIVLQESAAGLAQCLASQDASLRREILHGLFDIYRWDIGQGGLGASEDIPNTILEHAAGEEKRAVADWVRSVLPSGGGLTDQWHRQAYGALLLDLEGEKLDDEAYLRICRETSRWPDLVDRLLALGRVTEAEEVAEKSSDYELCHLADLLVAHEQAGAAEQLVRQRSAISKDARLLEWLKARAVARNDLDEALALAERLFWDNPGLPYYQQIRTFAQQLGRWEEASGQLLAGLEERSLFSILTVIHLDEGRVDQALMAFERTKERSTWWVDGSLRLRVAEAAIDAYPREAIRLFAEEVEHQIGRRNRGSYAEAAQLLRRVRELYRSLGDEAGWTAYIAGLRDRNRRLRALKEEIANAGL